MHTAPNISGSSAERDEDGVQGAFERCRRLGMRLSRQRRMVPVSYTHLTLPTNREV